MSRTDDWPTSPLPPMEAEASADLPSGGGWQYEPKWDGFRCLVFRDGDEVELQSKSMQPLARYFPEVVAAMRAVRARRFVLDGELVVPHGAATSFDLLLQRIHPAASRVARLARETPARYVAFDLLGDEEDAWWHAPLSTRRERLEGFVQRHVEGDDLVLSPSTTSLATARRWLDRQVAGRDGVVAKRLDAPYLAGERSAMVKVKLRRTADCVVGGFRYGRDGTHVGSLLLGLFGDDGLLHHVGFAASFPARDRPALTEKVRAAEGPPGFTGRSPGGPSRWSRGEAREFVALRHELVVEVEYDHFDEGRFRHGTSLVRWRPDKAPSQCTFDQVRR